jgi:Sigma-70 region 2
MPSEGRPAPDPVEHAPDLADTEASLLARAQAGDVGAFERLSGTFADRVFMLLLRLLGDPSEAEDAAQEVMLRAWQGITRFRGQSSYFTWLYRIAVNEANRALERRSRRPAAVVIGVDELQVPAPAALEDGAHHPAALGPRPGRGARPAAGVQPCDQQAAGSVPGCSSPMTRTGRWRAGAGGHMGLGPRCGWRRSRGPGCSGRIRWWCRGAGS